jgi:hypothetical protein
MHKRQGQKDWWLTGLKMWNTSNAEGRDVDGFGAFFDGKRSLCGPPAPAPILRTNLCCLGLIWLARCPAVYCGVYKQARLTWDINRLASASSIDEARAAAVAEDTHAILGWKSSA